MNLKIFSIISLALLFFTGCGSRQKTEVIPDVEIVTEWRTFDCGAEPAIDFVKLTPPTWKIIDGNFTLTPDEYAKLGESFSMIIKSVKQMRLKVQYYETCIERAGEERGTERK